MNVYVFPYTDISINKRIFSVEKEFLVYPKMHVIHNIPDYT